MKNTRALLMIGISLIAGIAAMILAARWLNQQTSLATRKVAVAQVDLSIGQPLGANQIRLVEWPSGAVPTGAFSDTASLVGRVTKTNLLRDEPILEHRLAPEGSKGGLSAVISQGKRAITVRVNDVVGVAGFALPGNYVDVVVNTLAEGARRNDKDRSISKIVLERILVLAVAQEASRDETQPKVVNAVTLEVTPEEAEKIDLARSIGTLSLVLRNQVDPQPALTAGATKDALLRLQAAVEQGPKKVYVPVRVATAPKPRPQTCVDVITGVKKTSECFYSDL